MFNLSGTPLIVVGASIFLTVGLGLWLGLGLEFCIVCTRKIEHSSIIVPKRFDPFCTRKIDLSTKKHDSSMIVQSFWYKNG